MTDWEVVIELSDSDSESESDDSVIELSSDSDSEECTGGKCFVFLTVILSIKISINRFRSFFISLNYMKAVASHWNIQM